MLKIPSNCVVKFTNSVHMLNFFYIACDQAMSRWAAEYFCVTKTGLLVVK